jgi:hypothetical protein
MAVVEEGITTCCYARSDRYWLTDPQGLAWEQFHTQGDAPVFGKPASRKAAASEAGAASAVAQATSAYF